MGYFVLSFPKDLIMGYIAITRVYEARGMNFDILRQLFYFLSYISYFPIIYAGLLSMSIFYWVGKKQKKGISKFRPLRLADNEEGFLVMILLMLLSMIFFEICFYAYPDQGHLLFYFPLSVILISWYYSPLLTRGLRNIEFRNLTITLIILVILAIFVSFLAGPDNPFKAIKILKEEKKYSAFTKIKSVSAKIEAITKPNDKLLTFVPILSLYSKRDLLPGLETGYCGYYQHLSLAQTQKRRLYNLEQIKI
ncbi:MAG: hypothetical protein ABSE95_02275 [Thermodesulfobacteriota bacterium]